MTNRIAVLGGSFNPPTVAHLRLMQAGMNAIDACAGIFVPTGYEYVAKKMRKKHCAEDVLSESLRVEMLESFREEDDRVVVSQVRLVRDDVSFDYDMLCALQEDYPDSELYFIIGSDKLYPLPRWYCVNELLARFRVLVGKRSADDIERIKEIKPYLADPLGCLHRVFRAGGNQRNQLHPVPRTAAPRRRFRARAGHARRVAADAERWKGTDEQHHQFP